MNKKIIVFSLNIVNFLYAGFAGDVLIKTDTSNTPIQLISSKNNVVSLDIKNNFLVNAECIETFTSAANYYYHIVLPHDSIICSEDQKFYDPHIKKWLKASQLSKKSYFLDYYGESVPCVQIDKIEHHESIIFYDICLNKPHTYYVSKSQILAHNVVPVVIGFSWAIGEGIALTGAGVGLGTLGLGLWQKFGKNKKITFAQIEQKYASNSAGGPPEDPNKDDSLQSRRNKAERLANEMGFREVKDYKFNSHGEKVFRKGNIEITLDRDSHNGGFWKMFKRKTYNRLGTYTQDLSTKIGK